VRCAQCGQEFTAPPLVCRYCGKELSLAERFYKSRRGHYLCKACYENKKEDKPQEHGARNTLGVMVLAVIIFLCALYVIMREMTRQ
jgi:predicted amidophosphoribosyltransferase